MFSDSNSQETVKFTFMTPFVMIVKVEFDRVPRPGV